VYHAWLDSQDFGPILFIYSRFPLPMKKSLILLLSVLVLALPGAAQARPGRLDRSFGVEGRVTTRVGAPSPSAGSYFAWAGGGRIVAAAGSQLLEYLPDGRLDKRFGEGGRVKIGAAENSSFDLSGLAVDSRGRILVSGTSLKPVSGIAESAAAVVQRFLPSGRQDASFGSDGTALNYFAAPQPLHEGAPTGTGPFVRSSGLLVDRADQPILTGSWLKYHPTPCYYLYCYGTSTPFVARLHEDGSVDTSFGSGGIFVPPTKEQASTPTMAGEDLLFVTEEISCVDRCGGAHPVLGGLDESGALDLSFAADGLADLPFFWRPPTIAVDRFGRILLSGAGEGESLLHLQRLNTRGLPDVHFGEDGSRLVNLPRGARQVSGAFAVDHQGRPLLAISGRRKGQNYAILLRRNQHGGRDRGFGNNGQVWTVMPDVISPTRVLLGGNGKIIVGGPLGNNGIALVRYRGD
jgi:uncharacterized delta-60 repeat protein